MEPFQSFGKIPRFFRDIIITEKIDGTNAQIYITEDGDLIPGSRKRYLTLDNDNFGFAAWCLSNKEELLQLGPGRHYGEWWGKGIRREYDLKTRYFSLFNVSRWNEERPKCCSIVPVLYTGRFSEKAIEKVLTNLVLHGSQAAPGFKKPEGIIIYHERGEYLYKVTLGGDKEKEE